MPTPPAHRAMTAQEGALLLALSAIWGSSFFFYKILGATLPPFTLVLGRTALAAAALNLVLAARGQSLGRRAPWGSLAVLGVLNSVIPFSLFAWAETQVTSGMAAMLNATTPLFAVVLAHFLTAERLSWGRAAGVVLGLCGVAVLVGPAAWRGAGANLLGDGACVLASFSYAVGGQFARRLHGLGFLRLATGQITAGAVVMLPLAAAADHFWRLPVPGLSTWSALAGIALLCTAVAYILFFRLMATAGATNAMLVTFIQPISALILGWLALGEAVPLRAYGGMLLIGCGLACIDGRALRNIVRPGALPPGAAGSNQWRQRRQRRRPAKDSRP